MTSKINFMSNDKVKRDKWLADKDPNLKSKINMITENGKRITNMQTAITQFDKNMKRTYEDFSKAKPTASFKDVNYTHSGQNGGSGNSFGSKINDSKSKIICDIISCTFEEVSQELKNLDFQNKRLKASFFDKAVSNSKDIENTVNDSYKAYKEKQKISEKMEEKKTPLPVRGDSHDPDTYSYDPYHGTQINNVFISSNVSNSGLKSDLSSNLSKLKKKFAGSTENLDKIEKANLKLDDEYREAKQKYDHTLEILKHKVNNWNSTEDAYVKSVCEYLQAIHKRFNYLASQLAIKEASLINAISNIKLPVFEQKIEVHLENAKLEIPAPLNESIEWLLADEHRYSVEGIFRIAGSEIKITSLKNKFDSGDYNLNDTGVHDAPHDPHTISCFLGRYLRTLPELLITEELESHIKSNMSDPNYPNRENDMKAIWTALNEDSSYESYDFDVKRILKRLFQFLNIVALEGCYIIYIYITYKN